MKSPSRLLCIVPPYSIKGPPLTAATLLGFLASQGRDDVGFLDLRLGTSNVYAPTYVTTGAAGETYAMDVPDLPLVLSAIASDRRGAAIEWNHRDPVFATYCRERSIDAEFLARYLSSITRYLTARLAELESLTFIGFSVWTSNYLSTLIACMIVRRRFPEATVVLGGPQVTESRGAARLALASGLADRVVRGEGEQALLELLTEHGDGRPAPSRALDDAIIERPLLRVKQKPLPDFEKMDVAAYQFHGDRVTIPFELSRGCTDKCSFCSEWVFWRKFRSDDPLRVVAQIQELSRRYDARDIYFVDSLLNGVPSRLMTFAEELLSRGIEITWGGFMRASMDQERARLLKRAGLRRVFIGIESMSDETLQLMNKRRTQADNIRALEAFLGAGLEAVDCGLIPGFPGDTPERFTATLRELVRLRERYGQLSIKIEPFSITPGQPVFQRLADFGLERHDWPGSTLALAPELAEITGALTHRVTGANQGARRSEATRLAYAMVRGDEPEGRRFDPFAYSRGEDVVDTEIDDWPIVARDGAARWFGVQAKSASGERRVLIASAEERARLLEALRRSGSPAARSVVVDNALRELAARHLRTAATRATWPSELRAAPSGMIAVHPTLVVRDSESADIGLILMPGREGSAALTCDGALEPLLVRDAPTPAAEWRAALNTALDGASAATVRRYAEGLIESGCFCPTGARVFEPEAAPEPSKLVQIARPRRGA